MDKPVIIFSGKGLGKAAIDIFQSNNVTIYGVLDDDQSMHGTSLNEVPVLGSTDDEQYLGILGKDCDAFLAFDDNSLRKSYVDNLRRNYKTMPVNAIHHSAFIASTASIHHGSLINSKVLIGAFAEVGNHCIIHSGGIIDYEVHVSDYVQIGAGSVINSGVHIDEGAFIGSGVTIVSGVKIGENARIGAGSLVIENVEKGATVFGNPAKPVN